MSVIDGDRVLYLVSWLQDILDKLRKKKPISEEEKKHTQEIIKMLEEKGFTFRTEQVIPLERFATNRNNEMRT